MDEEPTKDLATRAFQKRVLDEFAAVRSEIAAIRTAQSVIRNDIAEMRTDIAELRAQQAAMVKNLAAIDQRLTSLEERVDARLKETRPIWEAVQLQIERLHEKFDNVIRDLYDVRCDLGLHDKRLGKLEVRVLT